MAKSVGATGCHVSHGTARLVGTEDSAQCLTVHSLWCHGLQATIVRHVCLSGHRPCLRPVMSLFLHLSPADACPVVPTSSPKRSFKCWPWPWPRVGMHAVYQAAHNAAVQRPKGAVRHIANMSGASRSPGWLAALRALHHNQTIQL